VIITLGKGEMDLNFDVKELLVLFNVYQVKYLVVGGYAYGFHLRPRYTDDFDVWVKPDLENAERVYQALEEFGAPLDRYTSSDFGEEHYFYPMGAEPNAIDVMMSVSGLSFDAAWENRIEFDYHGTKVQVVSKQDLITAKLAAGRPRISWMHRCSRTRSSGNTFLGNRWIESLQSRRSRAARVESGRKRHFQPLFPRNRSGVFSRKTLGGRSCLRVPFL
jgi:hypothetical protein